MQHVSGTICRPLPVHFCSLSRISCQAVVIFSGVIQLLSFAPFHPRIQKRKLAMCAPPQVKLHCSSLAHGHELTTKRSLIRLAVDIQSQGHRTKFVPFSGRTSVKNDELRETCVSVSSKVVNFWESWDTV